MPGSKASGRVKSSLGRHRRGTVIKYKRSEDIVYPYRPIRNDIPTEDASSNDQSKRKFQKTPLKSTFKSPLYKLRADRPSPAPKKNLKVSRQSLFPGRFT